MNRIYCAVGKIVEITQLIEKSLGDICEQSEIIKEFSRHVKISQSDYNQVVDDAKYLKEKMTTMTFGALIGVIYDSRTLNRDEIDELKNLLEKRNYFAHEYFKYTEFKSEIDINDEFSALKEFISKLNKFLSRLEMIKSSQGERLNYLISKNNL